MYGEDATTGWCSCESLADRVSSRKFYRGGGGRSALTIMKGGHDQMEIGVVSILNEKH